MNRTKLLWLVPCIVCGGYAASAQEDPPPPVLGTFPVYFEAEGPQMQLRPADKGSATICSTPCTLYLPPGGMTFHALAPGRPLVSAYVNVQPPGQRVLLRSSSMGRLIGGGTMLFLGSALALGGGLLFGIGAANSQEPTTPSLYPAGAALGTVGLGFLLGGGLLLRGAGWGVKRVTPYYQGAVP